MFYVGQKVICVDGRPSGNGYGNEQLPKQGGVYTVRAIVGRNLRLLEIVNQPRMYARGFEEASFHPSRFRPILDRSIDISTFHSILNDPYKQIEGVV